MIPSAIITMARNQTNTSTDIVDNDEAYTYLNIILADYWKDITDKETSRDMTSRVYDLVLGTATYTLASPIAWATLLLSTFGTDQLSKIWVKLKSTDTYYTPVALRQFEGYLNLPDDYAANQPTSNPTAITNGTEITIYPTPTESVTNGLQIRWPQAHFLLSSTTEDVEWCILISSKRHYVIAQWLKSRFYGKRGSDFEWLRLQSEQLYKQYKKESIAQMWEVMQESSSAFIPDLSYLW